MASFITKFRDQTGDEFKDYTDVQLAKAFHAKYQYENDIEVDFNEFAKEMGLPILNGQAIEHRGQSIIQPGTVKYQHTEQGTAPVLDVGQSQTEIDYLNSRKLFMDDSLSVSDFKGVLPVKEQGQAIIQPGSVKYEHTTQGPTPVNVSRETIDKGQLEKPEVDTPQVDPAYLRGRQMFMDDLVDMDKLKSMAYDSTGDAVLKAFQNVPEDFRRQISGLRINQNEESIIELYTLVKDLEKNGIYQSIPHDNLNALFAQNEKLYNDLQASESGRKNIIVEPGSLAYYASGAASSVSNTAPALLAGLIAGPEVSLLMFYAQSKGEAYLLGRESGLDPRILDDFSTLKGLAEAIPELLPINVILRPGFSLASRTLKGGAAEVLQEEITEILNIGIDAGYIKPDMTWAEARQRMVDAGVLATIVGPTQAAMMYPLVKAKETLSSPAYKLAKELDREVAAADFSVDEENIIRRMDPNQYAPDNSSQAVIVEQIRESANLEEEARKFAEKAQPIPGDRRHDVVRAETGDRRANVDKRKRVAEMTPEEMQRELLTSPVTNIPNRRAYEERERQPVQVSIDADSLKWINDNMSPQSGDEMLKAIGQALAEETDTAAHFSGDEFMAEAATNEDATQIMERVNNRLKDAEIYIERPDGTIIIKKGLQITYGLGGSKNDADYALKQEKVRREQAGERAARGEEPPGITRQRAEGQQDNQGQTAEEGGIVQPVETEVAAPSKDTEQATVEPAPAPRPSIMDDQVKRKEAIQNAKSIAEAAKVIDDTQALVDAIPKEKQTKAEKYAADDLWADLDDLARWQIDKAKTVAELDAIHNEMIAAGFDPKVIERNYNFNARRNKIRGAELLAEDEKAATQLRDTAAAWDALQDRESILKDMGFKTNKDTLSRDGKRFMKWKFAELPEFVQKQLVEKRDKLAKPTTPEAPKVTEPAKSDTQDIVKPAQYGEGMERVQHVTRKNKTLTGIIDKSITLDEAKKIDPYAFKKDGGVFIRDERIAEFNKTGAPAPVKTETAKPKAPEAEPAKPDNTKRIEKLREIADGMQAQIDAKMNPAVGNQNPTPRRSRILESMRSDGERMARIQNMLREIANRLENGTLDPLLENISTKAEIETILGREEPPTVIWNPRDSRELGEAIAGLRGIKEDRDFFNDRLGWRDGKLNDKETEVVDRLIKAAEKAGRKVFKYSIIHDWIASWKRAQKLEIKTADQWKKTREALLALDKPFDPKQAQAQSIDKMERDLIGKKIPGFFPTPDAVIERMLDEARIQKGERVLEPSAGHGAIMDAIRKADTGAEVEGFELNGSLREILVAKDHKILGEDFLQYDGGPYDKIVMNPPFEKNQDIAHVMHAYSLLRPGGRIVAIMSEHPFFANDAASKEFRAWLDTQDHTTEKLPDAFKTGKIRTTGVASRMVVINKPEIQAAEKPKPVAPSKQAIGLVGIEYGPEHKEKGKSAINAVITLKDGSEASVFIRKTPSGWSLYQKQEKGPFEVGVIHNKGTALDYSVGYTKKGAKQVLEYLAGRAVGVNKQGGLVFEGDPRDALYGIELPPHERWVKLPKTIKAPNPSDIGWANGSDNPWFKTYHGIKEESEAWTNGHVIVMGKNDVLEKKINNFDAKRHIAQPDQKERLKTSTNRIIQQAVKNNTLDATPIALYQSDPLRDETEIVMFDVATEATAPLAISADYYRMFKQLYPAATFKANSGNLVDPISVHDGEKLVGIISPLRPQGTVMDNFPVIKLREFAKELGARDFTKPRTGGGDVSSRAAPDDTVAMSTAVNSWAPGANYAGQMNQSYNPADRTSDFDRDPVRRETVLRNFAKNIGIRLYQGRVKGESRLGFYRPGREEIRIKNLNDLETAAHEIAHYLDDVIWNGFGRRRHERETRPWLHGTKARVYANELKTISYDAGKVYEGFAEFIRHWMTRPEIARQAAPEFFDFWEGFVKVNETYGKALRQAQTEIMGYFAQRSIERATSKIGDSGEVVNDALTALEDRGRQYAIDDLTGLLMAQTAITGDINAVSSTPYETARLMRAAHSVVSGALEYGPPMVQSDGEWVFRDRHGNADHIVVERNGRRYAKNNPVYKKWGLNDVLAPVAHQLDEWTLYAVGMSAAELAGQGREHLFSKDEIQSMIDMGRDRPHFKQVLDEYQKWNGAILDFAEWSGIIGKDQRKAFRRSIYIPFYRVAHGNGVTKQAVPGHVKPIHRLTGGTANLRPILDNMVQNATNLIVEGIKNNARREAAAFFSKQRGGGQFMTKISKDTKSVSIDKDQIQNAFMKAAFGMSLAQYRRMSDVGQGDPAIDAMLSEVEMNMADFVKLYMYGQPPKGSDLIAVMYEGKPEFYQVADPLLMRSFQSFTREHLVNQNIIGRAAATIKQIGQTTITLSAGFMGANIARDTVSATILSNHGFTPVIDSLRGLKSRITSDANYRQYIANGGGFASYLVDPETFEDHLRTFYVERGLDFRTVLHTPKKLLLGLELVADSFEMATRLGENYRAFQKGETARTSAFSGREISADFAMRGDSKALGTLYDTIIFLKAAAIGLDREVRGFARDSNKAKVMAYTAGLAAASTLLYMMNRGNPCYDELEDWDKDVNWHIVIGDPSGDCRKAIHLRIPKPWQFGAISSGAERSMEAYLDKVEKGYVDGPEYANRLRKIFADLLQFEYIPQIAVPMFEVYALNENRFSGRPIRSETDQSVLPFAQYGPYTNRSLVELAELTADMPPELQISPTNTEALLRGYFNSWGVMGLQMADQVIYGDELPEKNLDQYPLMGRFTRSHPIKRTQSEAEFWEMVKEAGLYSATADNMIKKQKERLAEKFIGSDQNLVYDVMVKLKGDVQQINEAMIMIQRDKELTPEQKRQQLDDMQVEKNKLFHEIMIDLKAAMHGVKPIK